MKTKMNAALVAVVVLLAGCLQSQAGLHLSFGVGMSGGFRGGGVGFNNNYHWNDPNRHCGYGGQVYYCPQPPPPPQMVYYAPPPRPFHVIYGEPPQPVVCVQPAPPTTTVVIVKQPQTTETVYYLKREPLGQQQQTQTQIVQQEVRVVENKTTRVVVEDAHKDAWYGLGGVPGNQ